MSVSDLAGTTWIFNTSLNFSAPFDYGMGFVSNNTSYDKMFSNNGGKTGWTLSYGIVTVYDGDNRWVDDSYRTVSFNSSTPITTTSVIAWVEANATQISSVVDKLIVTKSELEAIADAIRVKTGQSGDLVYPNGFISAINSIQGV